MDLAKQVGSAIVSAFLPYLTTLKIFQLAFVNPQVPADVWLITAVLTFIASFFTYSLAKPQTVPAGARMPPASRAAVVFAVLGLFIALLSLFALIVITQRVLAMDAGWESVLIRVAYACLFIGMGPPIGFSLCRALG
jgi:hypothetical protein